MLSRRFLDYRVNHFSFKVCFTISIIAVSAVLLISRPHANFGTDFTPRRWTLISSCPLAIYPFRDVCLILLLIAGDAIHAGRFSSSFNITSTMRSRVRCRFFIRYGRGRWRSITPSIGELLEIFGHDAGMILSRPHCRHESNSSLRISPD